MIRFMLKSNYSDLMNEIGLKLHKRSKFKSSCNSLGKNEKRNISRDT